MSKLSQAFSKALGAAQSRFGSTPTAIRRQPSVHLPRHFGRGAVRLSDYSSLRKLMRAGRRGKLPEERLGIIGRAGKRGEAPDCLSQLVHA